MKLPYVNNSRIMILPYVNNSRIDITIEITICKQFQKLNYEITICKQFQNYEIYYQNM